MTSMMINCGNKMLDKISIEQIVLFFMLTATVATHVTNAKINIKTSFENNSLTAQGTTSAHMATTSSSPIHTFAWGHVTKYASILFDEDIVVKGFKTVDVKYSIEDDNNDFTIIGIYGSEKLAFNSVPTSASSDITTAIIEGGIGYNYTTIRFLSQSLNDYQYNLIIYGVDV